MARHRPEVIVFGVDDLTAVVARMDAMLPAGGWLSLRPGFDAGTMPSPRRSLGLFTAKGPYVPVCTWVPGERSRNGIEYTALGIQHGFGAAIVDWLGEHGLPVPEGAEVVEDHPRRGLVVAVPTGSEHATVLGWLLDVGDRLCPVQLTGEWQAAVHTR